MKSFLLLLILTCKLVFAYTYEHQILQINAKIIPRIVLMSEQTNVPHPKDINIAIIYEESDDDSADILESYLKKSYPKGLGDRCLRIQKISYSAFKSVPEHTLLFLLDAQDIHIEKILSFSKAHQLITMSYHDRYLHNGVVVSLHVGKSLKPYLNLHAAKESHIIFNSMLIAISKIFYPKEQP